MNRIEEGLAQRIERAFALVGVFPTTQGAFVIASIMSLATCARYVLSHDVVAAGVLVPHWTPDGLWLGFLSGALINATAHAIGKRLTDTDYRRAIAGAREPASEQTAPPAWLRDTEETPA